MKKFILILVMSLFFLSEASAGLIAKCSSPCGKPLGFGYYAVSHLLDIKSQNVISIEEDQILSAYPVIESRKNLTWGLEAIDVASAWEITKGNSDLIVAVIDTGVDYKHGQLKNNIWENKKEIPNNGIDDDKNGYIDDTRGYNFSGRNGDPFDDNMHGTHCAGVISSSNYGVAPNVKIMPLKFLNKSGSGSLSDALPAIKYAVDNGAKIISNSWGGGNYSQALYDAIKYAKDHGVLFIAAAGNDQNDNDKKPSYPASYKLDNVISVAASTSANIKASFSNYGKETVHLFAPGLNIMSTVPNNGAKSLSGTSMATPFVAGVAALVLSKYPDADYLTVKEALMKSCRVEDGFKGFAQCDGVINAKDSL